MRKRGSKFWSAEFPFKPSGTAVHYGWVIAVAGAMGMVASIPGQTNGVNVFSEELVDHLGLTRRQVSDAYFWGTLCSGLLLPFVGFWYDRLGARKLSVLANVCLGLSLFYLSWVDWFGGGEGKGVWFALIVGFFLIRFWGQGQVTQVSRNMVGKWWKDHRGKVLSVSGIAVSACFSLAPLFYNWLIESFGWREAWQLLGLVSIFGFGTMSWLLFRDNPGECRLEMDAGLDPPKKKEDAAGEFQAIKDFTRREAVKVYAFWVFCLIFGLQGLYFTAFSFHVIDIGRDIGMEKERILWMFLPLTFGGSAVSLFVGWASDRWRLKWLMCLMASGIFVGSIGMYLKIGFWTPLLFIGGMSIVGGCFGTLSGAFIPRFFGFEHMGKISSVFMSLLVIASAIGPSAFSLVFDLWGSYGMGHLGVACVAGVLGIGVLWADNPQRKLADQRSEA